MDGLTLYVLTTLIIDAKGTVTTRNVGVTFDIFEAERHKGDGIENDFETFPVSADWREDAEQSRLIRTMRDFRELVADMQEAALR
jgi:hypothetical protein